MRISPNNGVAYNCSEVTYRCRNLPQHTLKLLFLVPKLLIDVMMLFHRTSKLPIYQEFRVTVELFTVVVKFSHHTTKLLTNVMKLSRHTLKLLRLVSKLLTNVLMLLHFTSKLPIFLKIFPTLV